MLVAKWMSLVTWTRMVVKARFREDSRWKDTEFETALLSSFAKKGSKEMEQKLKGVAVRMCFCFNLNLGEKF